MTIPLHPYATRHAISIAIAIFLTVLLNHYFSMSHTAWMVITAWLVSQTSRGTPLKQISLFFLVIIIMLSLLSWLNTQLSVQSLIVMLAAIYLLTASLLWIKQPQSRFAFYQTLFFFVVFAIILLLSQQQEFLHDKVMDIFIGALIALFCNRLFSPLQFDREFSQGLLPLLQAMMDYCKAWSLSHDHHFLDEKIAAALQAEDNHYPEWVYEVGFNPGLRSGSRFFLINIERVSEIFFSLQGLYSQKEVAKKSRPLAAAMTTCMESNGYLLKNLHDYFFDKKVDDSGVNFTSDIVALEQALQNVVPNDLELLDVAPDYVALTAMVRDMKDLRRILLQLVTALPTVKTN